MREIYLDNAATTPVNPGVIDAMMPYFTDKWHNPSSLYSPSVQIKKDIESARKIVADFIHADAREIYFTSSGSESNCWAIRGWLDNQLMNGSRSNVIITTPIEHKSIMAMDVAIVSKFGTFATVNVDKHGYVDIEHLEMLLKENRKSNMLVSIQVANNEIGTIQKVGKLSWLAHKYDAVFHVDAVQAFGHIPIHVDSMGIDMLSASGHKIGTPKGIGILYKASHIEIEPLIYGGQMNGMRGGTENVPYIVGMAKAVEIKSEQMKDSNWNIEMEYNRNKVFKRFEEIGCKIIGCKDMRLPNNINVMLPEGVGAEEMLYMLDTSNIYISTGSACNSHAIEPSHVLKAIGLTDEEASRCIRITLPDDIDYDIIDEVVNEIYKNIKLLQLEYDTMALSNNNFASQINDSMIKGKEIL